MKINKNILILSAIIIMFFISNLIIIEDKSIFVDEAITYNIVNKLSFNTIMSGIDVHPPIYYSFVKSLPNNDSFFMIRFYSLVFAVAAIIIMSSTMYKYYSFKHSFIITSIMCLSMTVSHYSIEARMYSLLLLFSSLTLRYMIEKKYNYALFMIAMSFMTHYYAIMLFVPYTITLFINDRKHGKTFFQALLKSLIPLAVIVVIIIILSPYIINQITNNPYKIPPPDTKTTLGSLPSMLVFPFVVPSSIENLYMFMFSTIMIVIIITLIMTYKDKVKYLWNYSISSYMTMLIMFLPSLIFLMPYHHRYTIMFFPTIYYMLTISIMSKKFNVQRIMLGLILIYLSITTFSYHINPPDELLQLSQDIKGYENILHETPFSFLSLKMYLPNNNHYIGRSGPFNNISHVTVYTTPEFVDNPDVEYDLYLHHFDELLVEPLLVNSPDVELMRID